MITGTELKINKVYAKNQLKYQPNIFLKTILT